MDRANLQKEVNSLSSEIDRISKSANFNGIKLLDGSLSGMEVNKTVGTEPNPDAGKAITQQFSINKAFTQDGDTINIDGKNYTFKGTNADNSAGEFGGATAEDQARSLAAAINADADSRVKASYDGEKIKLESKDGDYKFKAPTVSGGATAGSSVENAGSAFTISGTSTNKLSMDFSTASGNFKAGETVKIAGQTFTFTDAGDTTTRNGVAVGANLDETMKNLADALNQADVAFTGKDGSTPPADVTVKGTFEYSSAEKALNFVAATDSTVSFVSTAPSANELQIDGSTGKGEVTYTKPAEGAAASGSIALPGQSFEATGASASFQFSPAVSAGGAGYLNGTTFEIGGQTYKVEDLKKVNDGTQATQLTDQLKSLEELINKNENSTVTAKFNGTDSLVLTTKETGARVTSVGDVKVNEAKATNITAGNVEIAATATTNGTDRVYAGKASLEYQFDSRGGNFAVGDKLTFAGVEFTMTSTASGTDATSGSVDIKVQDTFEKTMEEIVNVLNTTATPYKPEATSGDKIAGTWKFDAATQRLSFQSTDSPATGEANKFEFTTSVIGNVAYEPVGTTGNNVFVNGVDGVSATVVNGVEAKDAEQAKIEYTLTSAASGQFAEGESITINGLTMQFGSGANQVALGADFKGTMDNLAAKLNAEASTVEGAAGTWAYSDGDKKLTWTQTSGGNLDVSSFADVDNKIAYTGVTTQVSLSAATGSEAAGADAYTVTGLDGSTTPSAGAEEVVDAKTEITFNNNLKSGNTFQVGDTKYQLGAKGDKVEEGFTLLEVEPNEGGTYNGADVAAALAKAYGKDAVATDNKVVITGQDGKAVDAKAINAGGLTLQVGESSEEFQKVTVAVGKMDAESLGIGDISVGTQEGAAAAIDKIKTAINTVSSTRGDLGAIQNRLEHTINNLGVTTENMTAAESRIRDTDMAKEMMEFTKNNILVQASQAMLAQANQLPQGVLQLLQ